MNWPKPQRYDQMPDGDEHVSEVTRWPRLIDLENIGGEDLDQLNGFASIAGDANGE